MQKDVPSEAATAAALGDGPVAGLAAAPADAVAGGQADRWGERLPRQLGLLNAIAVLVGVTIGSGIFRVPATVAAQLHDPGPVILCWVLGGVVALFGALTIAELAAALPRSGGIFALLLGSFWTLAALLSGFVWMAVVARA